MEKEKIIEIVEDILKRCGCQTSKQISYLCKRWYDLDITPSRVGGILRGMSAKGLVGSSNCGYGATVYWLCKNEWEEKG